MGNKRCFCPSVHPSVPSSVFPSVAYIANNSRTQRPSVPKFKKKVSHFRCDLHTSFKSIGQRSGLEAGGAYRVGRTRRPHCFVYKCNVLCQYSAHSNINTAYSYLLIIGKSCVSAHCAALCQYARLADNML